MSGYPTMLPFERGKTWLDGVTADGNEAPPVGQEYLVKDDTHNTGRFVHLRLVKNNSGSTLLAKTLAVLNALGTEIVGLAIADYEQRVVPIDEKLPSGGVANGDWCYVVVGGPALVLTQIAQVAANIFAAGAEVRNTTINTTSGAGTTAGRLQGRELTSSVTVASQEEQASFGRAISAAATSGVTNSNILVDVKIKF